MRIALRIVGILVAALFVLGLIGLVLPGHFHVERSAVIAAKPAAIYPMIGDLRAWPQWGVWFKRDPAMQITYSASTTGVGDWSQWTSKTEGSGKMTISTSQAPEDFEYHMEFTDMGMTSRGTLRLTDGPAGTTRVTMTMRGDLGHSPLNRWFGLFMDKMVGPDFDEGLANLRKISEAPTASERRP